MSSVGLAARMRSRIHVSSCGSERYVPSTGGIVAGSSEKSRSACSSDGVSMISRPSAARSSGVSISIATEPSPAPVSSPYTTSGSRPAWIRAVSSSSGIECSNTVFACSTVTRITSEGAMASRPSTIAIHGHAVRRRRAFIVLTVAVCARRPAPGAARSACSWRRSGRRGASAPAGGGRATPSRHAA